MPLQNVPLFSFKKYRSEGMIFSNVSSFFSVIIFGHFSKGPCYSRCMWFLPSAPVFHFSFAVRLRGRSGRLVVSLCCLAPLFRVLFPNLFIHSFPPTLLPVESIIFPAADSCSPGIRGRVISFAPALDSGPALGSPV